MIDYASQDVLFLEEVYEAFKEIVSEDSSDSSIFGNSSFESAASFENRPLRTNDVSRNVRST